MIDDRNDLEFVTDDIDTGSIDDVDTVSEESVDEVKEVSKMSMGRAVTRSTPAPETVIGTFSYVRTVGGSEVSFDKIKENTPTKFNPQGNVEVSFTLSGDILSLVPKKDFLKDSDLQAKYDKLNANTDSLSTIIQKAYEETIKDANSGFTLKAKTDFTEREKLSYALRIIFSGDTSKKLKFIFNSNNNEIRTITFDADACFPPKEVCEDYIRHIVDLDAMHMGVGKTKANSSSDIPIKMIIREKTGYEPSTVTLRTNTDYRFVGIENDIPFTLNSNSGDFNGSAPSSTKLNVIGFNMGNFKTKKASPHITTKLEVTGSSNVHFIYPGTDGVSTASYTETYVYLSNIIKRDEVPHKDSYTTFIDMKTLRERSGVNSSGDIGEVNSSLSGFKSPIEVNGTSIKLKPLLFKDPDKAITKIEIEDNTGKLHTGKLSTDSLHSSVESGLAYIEVTGLERSMPYIFTKLHITSDHGDKEELKNIHFVSYESWTTGSSDLQVNTLPIRTTHFYGPKLECKDLTENSDGINVKSVKNDRTALRYILKPDNKEGILGDITVNGLRDEKYKIEKVLDSDGKLSYWILTLYNLLPDYDYSFLILELSYTDPNGNKSITRQALSEINKTTDDKFNNRTEKTPLPLNEQFEIVVKDKIESKDPRSVEIPVFVDDIHGKFVGIEMTPAKEHPDSKAEYEIGKIKFSNLTPDKTGVFRVDFLHNPDADNNSTYAFKNSNIQRIARYITITTPKVSDLDIKSATATVDMTTAEFKFEYYSDPKSPIKTIVVKDSAGKEIKSSFDKTTNVLKLEGLKEETKYSKVKVTFTLENSKTIEYTIEDFTTEKKEEKPTGKVAEFVAKVYKLALGREPEVEGWKFWVQKLESKELAVTQFIYDLMKQDEFVSRLMSREQFIKMMYEIIVGREPEEEGQKYWEQKYEEYRTQEPTLADVRMRIAREMMDTSEFKAYVASLGLKY